MISLIHHIGAFRQHLLYITLIAFLMGAEVPLIVRTDRSQTFPVLLRMDQYRIVLAL